MSTRLQRHEVVIKEYEEAFEAYLALAPAGGCRVSGARVTLEMVNTKAIEKAQQRLANAERELFELDAA